MESPACSKMKPMTIKQEAIMAIHKMDCTERNVRCRQEWQVKYQARKL